MASDETRRLLKAFGIAVTDYEDAVERGAPAAELAGIEAEAKKQLQEVTTLIQRLGARKK